MTYVTCPCGVRLLYLRTAAGPEQHWSKADIGACQQQSDVAEEERLPQCRHIDELVSSDFTDWRRRMDDLRRRPGSNGDGRQTRSARKGN